jgi:hypothetical protein
VGDKKNLARRTLAAGRASGKINAARPPESVPRPCPLSSRSLSEFDYEATLAACAAGDRAAMQRLYTQEGARLLGVVERIVRDRALAEDIVHDACVNIWTRAASFERKTGLGPRLDLQRGPQPRPQRGA